MWGERGKENKGERKIEGKGVKLTMGGITYIERPVGGGSHTV